MRKFRVLAFEVVGLGVLIGWLMWKYPELIDDIIPWVALLVAWHLTWEFVLDAKCTRAGAIALGRRINKMAAWVLIFVIGGLVSLLYWKGINKSMTRLAALAAQRVAAQHPNSSAIPAPQSPAAPIPASPSPTESIPRKVIRHPPTTQQEHRTVGVDSSTVKTTERLDGGLDFEIVIRIRNGSTENQVTMQNRSYFDGQELLPQLPAREFDMLPNQIYELTLTPFLGRQHAIEFRVNKTLVVDLTVKYNDAGNKMEYFFEGQAVNGMGSLDVVKTQKTSVR